MRRPTRFLLAALSLLGPAGCRAPRAVPASSTVGSASLTPGDGMLAVPGGRIWYRVVGSGPGTPLLLIHGGPGGRSCRLHELRALADERPVIFYDQLGTGRSERPADTTYWNVAHFVDEVTAIRQALGLREVHLLGHSWGGTVAAEYLLTRGMAGVRSVTLAAPLLSTPTWIADANVLVSQLPEAQRAAIAEAEASRRYDSPAFAAANDSFSVRFNTRRAPSAAAAADCVGAPGNGAMYRAMWGPSEFSATGTLRDYDRTARLGELRLPVLLMAGEHDEARPETMRAFQRRIPGARVAIIPGAAHGMMNDEPAATVAAVRAFLHDAERAGDRGAPAPR
jgi:proline iminopeptidase